MSLGYIIQPALGGGAGHILIGSLGYSAVVQGTWATSITGANVYDVMPAAHAYFSNSTDAQNDELDYKVEFDYGATYTFVIVHFTNASGGILHLQLDGSDVGTLDTYSAGDVFGVRSTITGITPAGGLQTVGLKMATKNAASAAYRLSFNGFGFFRTA